VASSSDLVRQAAPNFATTLANSMLISDTTMTLASVTGLPTATGITLVIDATDPVSGASTPTLKEVVTGVVSGSTVTSLSRGLDGTTQQAHASGANVVMWITANLWNDFQTSYLVSHTQAGAIVATSPTFTTGIKDTNGNQIIGLSPTGSAVNQITVADAATGNPPTISATGSDTNIGISIVGKGTGTIALTPGSGGLVTLPGAATAGIFSERQGGSSTVWGTAGTSNYALTTTAPIIQAGVYAFSSASSGTDQVITFPTAYANAPIVFVSTMTANAANVTFAANTVGASSFKLRILFSGGGTQSESGSWWAIGV
jgi:hypothetical protein